MTKSKPQVKIVNVETGEEIVRDATPEEIAQMKIIADNAVAEKAQIEAKAAEKQALLDKLGITADEAKLLLG
jgi:ParB-like chromosome segregation protein Spo0J